MSVAELCSSVEPGCTFPEKYQEVTNFHDAFCNSDHFLTFSFWSLLSASLASAFPCLPVVFTWGKSEHASKLWACNHSTCGVMSKVPEVDSKTFVSFIYFLSHSYALSSPIIHRTFHALCSIIVSFFQVCAFRYVFLLVWKSLPFLFLNWILLFLL